jgi:hypothetical protein
LQQEWSVQDVVEGDWRSIEQTVLEYYSGDYKGDEQHNEDPEESIFEVVESQWIQRIAPKLQNCTVEEHPEAAAVSIFSRKLNTNILKFLLS